jgi:hypothetical protein
MRALHEMLWWTVYVMLLENKRKNKRQLREYAWLDRWVHMFWFAEDGASFARVEIRENAWPPCNDLADVSMWLFWFLLKPDASLSSSTSCPPRLDGAFIHPPSFPPALTIHLIDQHRKVGERVQHTDQDFYAKGCHELDEIYHHTPALSLNPSNATYGKIVQCAGCLST